MERTRTFSVAIAVLAGLAAGAPSHAQPTQIIAFGDSITRGFGDGGAGCDSTSFGYPPRVRNRLAAQEREVEFINEGACGELTYEGVSRIDQVLAAHPDAAVVILMEGTNDLSTFASLESIRFNVREMARKVEEQGRVPVILSAIPRGPGSGRDADNLRTAAFAGWLDYEANLDGRIFGDPFNALISIGRLFDDYYSDPWHPNRDGYDLLATTIAEAAAVALAPPEPPFGLSCTDAAGQPAVAADPCVEDPEGSVLCLRDGRFRLEVMWQDFAERRGAGQRVPLTRDTGTFYFFDPSNTELIVKILDASTANGFFWVFYGALSNVQYSLRVVDTVSGACRVYDNPAGTFASAGDTQALPGDLPDEPPPPEPEPPPLPEPPQPEPPQPEPPPLALAGPSATASTPPTAPEATCVADETTLCLQDGRFRVSVDWVDFAARTGVGMTVPLSADTGAFYFFRPSNIELVVKVLDGRGVNGHFWVFYGALSNVAYTLTVTDTASGESRDYENPARTFASGGDTAAFPLPEPAPDPAQAVPEP